MSAAFCSLMVMIRNQPLLVSVAHSYASSRDAAADTMSDPCVRSMSPLRLNGARGLFCWAYDELLLMCGGELMSDVSGSQVDEVAKEERSASSCEGRAAGPFHSQPTGLDTAYTGSYS